MVGRSGWTGPAVLKPPVVIAGFVAQTRITAIAAAIIGCVDRPIFADPRAVPPPRLSPGRLQGKAAGTGPTVPCVVIAGFVAGTRITAIATAVIRSADGPSSARPRAMSAPRLSPGRLHGRAGGTGPAVLEPGVVIAGFVAAPRMAASAAVVIRSADRPVVAEPRAVSPPWLSHWQPV